MTSDSGPVYEGRALVAGEARGEALLLEEPLSFWGGLDPRTGRIIDRRHPQHGAELRGRVVLMASGRGSSGGSSVLAEAVRLGFAPAGLVLLELDEIVVLGALAADELYGATLPVVLLAESGFRSIRSGDVITIELSGRLRVGAGS